MNYFQDVNDGEDDDEQQVVSDNKDIHVKRQRSRNMSGTQRKLLYSLVNSSEHLYKDKSDGVSTSCLKKRREWKKIAVKLNSVTGPQKTWTQWNKVERLLELFCSLICHPNISLIILFRTVLA